MFTNYNFRDHAQRRIMWEFRQNQGLTSCEAIAEKYQLGLDQLAMVERQGIISMLYAESKPVASELRK